jgi:hypothetical protein
MAGYIAIKIQLHLPAGAYSTTRTCTHTHSMGGAGYRRTTTLVRRRSAIRGVGMGVPVVEQEVWGCGDGVLRSGAQLRLGLARGAGCAGAAGEGGVGEGGEGEGGVGVQRGGEQAPHRGGFVALYLDTYALHQLCCPLALRERDVKCTRPVLYVGPSLSSALCFMQYAPTHTHTAQLTPEWGRAQQHQVYGAAHMPGRSASSVGVFGSGSGSGSGTSTSAAAKHSRAVPAAVRVWAPPFAKVELAAGVFTASFTFACAGGGVRVYALVCHVVHTKFIHSLFLCAFFSVSP